MHRAGVGGDALLNIGSRDLERLIEISPDLYLLKKRSAYLIAFKESLAAKAKKKSFAKPILNAHSLDDAFIDVVNYVQHNRFGAAVDLLKKESPDAFHSILKGIFPRLLPPESVLLFYYYETVSLLVLM